jgi:hypothetical protein
VSTGAGRKAAAMAARLVLKRFAVNTGRKPRPVHGCGMG